EIFRRLAVAVQLQRPVARLIPAVRLAAIIVVPGLELEIGVVAEQAKGRNDVFAKILVLVVTPDEDEIRVEVVEDLADGAEVVAKPLAAAVSRRQAVVVAEFGEQLVRPVGPVLVPRLDIRSGQGPLEYARQSFVRQAQRRPMSYAETEDFR